MKFAHMLLKCFTCFESSGNLIGMMTRRRQNITDHIDFLFGHTAEVPFFQSVRYSTSLDLYADCASYKQTGRKHGVNTVPAV